MRLKLPYFIEFSRYFISLTQGEFDQSGLYEKYRDQNKYGIPCFCPFFMASENVPPGRGGGNGENRQKFAAPIRHSVL